MGVITLHWAFPQVREVGYSSRLFLHCKDGLLLHYKQLMLFCWGT